MKAAKAEQTAHSYTIQHDSLVRVPQKVLLKRRKFTKETGFCPICRYLSPFRRSRRSIFAILSAFLALAAIHFWTPFLSCNAQDVDKNAASKKAKWINPAGFGFDIPSGEVKDSNGERYLTSNESGVEVVAKVHVKVGENFVMLMPDGQLVARRAKDVKPTDRPFKADDMKVIAKRLIENDLRQFKNMRARTSQKYLFIYNTSEEFAAVTNRIMDTMIRGVVLHSKAQNIKVEYPELPLIVIMFGSEAEFQRYKRMPRGVIAFYEILSNRVVLHEESSLTRLDRKLAIRQSMSVIAHEGAHQILHNIGVQKRLSIWPMWLSEGLAEYYAPTEPGRGLKWKGAGQINDFRMFELENYLNSKTDKVIDGSTIRNTVLAGRLTSTGYASAWSLTHFLAKTKKAEFNRLVREMSELGPLQGFPKLRDKPTIAENKDVFEAAFGQDWQKLETKLVEHLKRQRYTSPFAHFPHYAAMVDYPNGKKRQRIVRTFLSKQKAQAWASEFVGSLERSIRPNVVAKVQQFRNRNEANAFTSRWQNQ